MLSLIQSWADAFKNQPELSGVVQVYQDLLAKGIEFPATDLDAMAPIHTPERVIELFFMQFYYQINVPQISFQSTYFFVSTLRLSVNYLRYF